MNVLLPKKVSYSSFVELAPRRKLFTNEHGHEHFAMPRTDGARGVRERAILQYKYQDKAAYLAADFGSRTGVGVGGDSHATQSRFQITIIGGEKSGTKSDERG